MKRVLVSIALVSSITFLVFGLVIPKILESREPEMKHFLLDEGYKNPKLVDVTGWKYQVTFNTNKGLVKVIPVKGGGFAVKY
jgi:hypothetical protein